MVACDLPNLYVLGFWACTSGNPSRPCYNYYIIPGGMVTAIVRPPYSYFTSAKQPYKPTIFTLHSSMLPGCITYDITPCWVHCSRWKAFLLDLRMLWMALSIITWVELHNCEGILSFILLLGGWGRSIAKQSAVCVFNAGLESQNMLK